MSPFPSAKLGRVPLCSGGAGRKGVALRLPSPMSHPARSRVGHPLVPRMIVLFCFFFFFCFSNFARVPAARHSPAAATCPWAQWAPRSARSLCIRSAPGRSELCAPGSAAGTAGMWRGFQSLVCPLCVPDCCLCPLKAPGQGAGGNGGRSGSHDGTRDLGIRDRESDPEQAAEGEGKRGRGRRAEGAAGGGEPVPGAASRLFPPSPPSRRCIHCLRPSSSRSHRSPNLRLQMPCDPRRS